METVSVIFIYFIYFSCFSRCLIKIKSFKKQQQRRAKHESDKNIHERAERWIKMGFSCAFLKSLKKFKCNHVLPSIYYQLHPSSLLHRIQLFLHFVFFCKWAAKPSLCIFLALLQKICICSFVREEIQNMQHLKAFNRKI